MDIAALSVSLSQASLGTAVSISMLDMGQEQMQVQAEGLIKMMELSVNPHVGSIIDFKA